MDNQQWQVAGKALTEYAKEKQAWVQLALGAVNRWGDGDRILQHAIAEALEEAYAMGQAGTPPVYTPPEAPIGLLRRSRPEPPPAPAIIRRTRPEPPQPQRIRRTR